MSATRKKQSGDDQIYIYTLSLTTSWSQKPSDLIFDSPGSTSTYRNPSPTSARITQSSHGPRSRHARCSFEGFAVSGNHAMLG
jgi:hypothetical protein